MSSAKKRVMWLDICKGFAIFAPIIMHTYGPTFKIAIVACSLFPMFFFTSGYTIKKPESLSQLGKATLKDLRFILLPALLVYMLQGVYYGLVSEYGTMFWHIFDMVKVFFTNSNPGMMWFFWALFWSKLCYRIYLMVVKKYQIFPLLILTLIGYKISNIYRSPMLLDVIPICMLFLHMGASVKKLESYENVKKLAYIGLPVLTIVWAYLSFVKAYYIDISGRDYNLYTVVQSACILYMCTAFAKLIENNIIGKPFIIWGQHTLGMIFLHFLDGIWLTPIKNVIENTIGISNNTTHFIIRMTFITAGTFLCIFIKDLVLKGFNKLFKSRHS